MRAAAFLVTTFLSATLRAQVLPPVPEFKLDPIPAGDDRIFNIGMGDRAPYSGQLYDNDTALRWANYLEQCRMKHASIMRAQQGVCLLELSYRDKVLEVEKDSSKKVIDDFTARIGRLETQNIKLQEELAEGPPWYRSFSFGVVVGVAGTSAMIALTAWALSSVK